jgi:hypothetical protein
VGSAALGIYHIARISDLCRRPVLRFPGMDHMAVATIEDAPPEALPEALVEPPWVKEARMPRPGASRGERRVVAGLKPPSEQKFAWAPGEREEWAKAWSHGNRWAPAAGDFFREYRRDPAAQHGYLQAHMFATAPEELARPLIRDWRPAHPYYLGPALRPVVARFGPEARGAVVHSAKIDLPNCCGALLPFLDAEAARLAADALFRLRSAQDFGRAYFTKHGLSAVPYLVPDAVGKSRPKRRKALAALWFLTGLHGLRAVIDAARPYGDEAVEVLEDTLRSERPIPDAEKKRPMKPPELPWLDVSTLPRPSCGTSARHCRSSRRATWSR